MNDALNQLVERTIPYDELEQDAAWDDRYYRAVEAAREILRDDSPPSVVGDVHHEGDLIKRKCTSPMTALTLCTC